jgi:hypothetical protein
MNQYNRRQQTPGHTRSIALSMPRHPIRFAALGLVFALCGWSSASSQFPAPIAPSARPAEPPSRPATRPALQDMLSPGGAILRDQNGDGVVDGVDASLVLPVSPSTSEVASAANIAARLGFESAEMNLPLPDDGRVAIAVGVGALARANLAEAEAGLRRLAAGHGIVSLHVTAGGKPVLIAAGADDAGTRAAAEYVAGRLPHAWDVKGPMLAQIVKDAIELLTGRDAAPKTVEIDQIQVRWGADALERLVLRAEFDSPARLAKAATALREARAPVSPGSKIPRQLDYAGIASIRVFMTVAGVEGGWVDVPRATPPPPAPMPRRAAAGKDAIDLGTLYSIDGMLGDSDSNLIPDRTDILLVPDGPGIEPVITLAARIGLESTGISIPLVQPPDTIEKPATEPMLVLIGTEHPLINQLIKDKKFDRAVLKPGEGVVRLVRKAFGDKSAIVVTGADRAGLRRAITQVAERFPHVWPRGKDRPTIEDVKEDARRFFGGRSPAGQAAIGLYKLDQLLSKLPPAAELKEVVATMSLDHPPAGTFGEFVSRQMEARLPGVRHKVWIEGLDVGGATVETVGAERIGGEYDIPWEVDEFLTLVRTKVRPAVKAKSVVEIEARLSEPPEVRARLEREVKADLVKAGADPSSTVTVLCAYKQGYSWLYDVVRPALAGKPVDRLRIRFAEATAPPEWKQQAMFTPTRWLLEIFPIDEVLARDLPIELSRISFEKAPADAPTYQVDATANDGRVLYSGTFTPKTVIRPYFDRFPDYEKVRVTTGWITASVDGVPTASQRIVTDPERVWDIFQSQTLPRLYDYVMSVADGKPRPEDAPHFGTLTVDVGLSEPDYNLGIDKERISSLEALHEDVYFGTLHFFDVLGRMGRGLPLDYPGHIVPRMWPLKKGQPGRATITCTGFTVPRPRVSVLVVKTDGTQDWLRLDIPKAAVEKPSAEAAMVRAGVDGIDRLDLRLKVDTQDDQREAMVKRARAERVDEQILSAAQASWMVGALGQLRAAGLYREALAYPDLREIRVTASWAFDPSPTTEQIAMLPANGTPAALPDISRYETATARAGAPLVQWESAMAPDEAYGVLAALARFKGASVYKAGESYLGREIWAIDLTSPVRSTHWSQAKATTLKPTALFSARQHANEVSSTSHVLRLAELLLTDETYKKTLDKVNVVIHPITNPDGAAITADLSALTPDYMLHAGYLGSLGVDVTTAQWEADAIYPESKVRAVLWRTWLPDLFLNPHGYPSHEWVQLFSEYAGWVRNRVTESRDWWGMRGWFMPGFSYIDDPKYPRHKDAALKIRGFITQAINAVPDVRALNERAYDRYRRYGFAFDQENFKLDFTDNVLIYNALKGSKPNPRGTDPMLRQPNITIWSGTTEAPDEPASGEWMRLLATAGLEWDKAMIAYLAQGTHEIERNATAVWGGVSLSLNRARPPKDKKEE